MKLMIILFLFSLNVLAASVREIGFDIGTLKTQGSTPANPATGQSKLFVRDGDLRILNSAGLEKAVSVPRITTAQRTALSLGTTDKGMKVYDTDLLAEATWNGTAWQFGFGNILADNVYSADISTTQAVSGEVVDWIQGNCTSADPIVCTFKAGTFSVTPNCWASSKGTTYLFPITATSTISVSIQPQNSGGTPNHTQGFTLACQKQGADYAAASASVFATTNANYGWTSYSVSSPNSSITIASPECYQKREGGDLYIDCTLTASSNAALEARISLPSGLTTLNSFTNLKLVGHANRNNGTNPSNGFEVYVNPNTSYMTFGVGSVATNPTTQQNASSIFANGDVIRIKAGPIPIQGWANSNMIVGSFAGYAKAPGVDVSANPNIDTIAFSYGTTNSTTVCSASPCSYLDQLGSGGMSSFTRVSTGTYAMTFGKTYSKVKCTALVNATGLNVKVNGDLTCSTCNSISFSTGVPGVSTNDTYGTVNCIGQY